MRRIATDVRQNGITIVRNDFYSAVHKYQFIKARSIYEMYIGYYLDNPVTFRELDFMSALWEEFREYRKYVTSTMTGEIVLTPEIIDYAIIKANNPAFTSIMTSYKNYLIASEALNQYYFFATRNKFYAKELCKGRVKPSISVKSGLEVYRGITDKCPNKLGETGMFECFAVDEDREVVELGYAGVLQSELAKRVDVPMNEINTHIADNTAIFIEGISFEQEGELLPYLCDGTIVGDTDAGKRLATLVNSHYTNSNNGAYVSPLYGDLFTSSDEALRTLFDVFRSEYSECDLQSFYLTDNKAYFTVPKKVLAEHHGLKPAKREAVSAENMIGEFAFDHFSCAKFNNINLRYGVMGEFISEGDILANGYAVEALPVTMRFVEYKKDGTTKEVCSPYYSVADVHYSADKNEHGEFVTDTIEPKAGSVLSKVAPLTRSEVFSRMAVTNRKSLGEKLLKYCKTRNPYRYMSSVPAEREKGALLGEFLYVVTCSLFGESVDLSGDYKYLDLPATPENYNNEYQTALTYRRELFGI